MTVCEKQPTNTTLWEMGAELFSVGCKFTTKFPCLCLFCKKTLPNNIAVLVCAKYSMPSRRKLWHRQLYGILVHAEGALCDH